ncbi:unnamed protein product [Ostreobium quekettii]|uniref:Thioredoxin domain-containing protein n=1 Tax=Ostreobium quekettii TaxID=121088 RepID=A0A8S1IKH4_9CHLO|nr:unnamed protein product [Ostreobium quekettii]
MVAALSGAPRGSQGPLRVSFRALLCFACLPLLVRECGGRPKSDVVALTDENFDEKTSEGAWFVEVFAPWCSHCRKVEEVWQGLATRLKKEGINVGKIDGTRESGLMSRFEVQGFPMFFHLANGECREYDGDRSEEMFYEFATDGWKKEAPWPFYKAPNSPVGRRLGSVKRWFSGVLIRLREVYHWLHTDMGLSELCILVVTLSVPVALGLSCICVLDFVNTRRSAVPDFGAARPHTD